MKEFRFYTFEQEYTEILLCPSPYRILEWVAISFSRRSFQPRSPSFSADALPSKPPGKSYQEAHDVNLSRKCWC